MKFGNHNFLTFGELPTYLSLSRTKCRDLYREYKAECDRPDTKLGVDYYVEMSVKTKWVHKGAFDYYIKNYKQLSDDTARKRVANYTKEGGEIE